LSLMIPPQMMQRNPTWLVEVLDKTAEPIDFCHPTLAVPVGRPR
jgi:hypothetical protein